MNEERIDILNRDQFVESVFTIINNLSNNRKSCTFAIDGDWGSGKSFVLDMLEDKLSQWQNEETTNDQFMVFHYNCWQYDYFEEPLVAIVSSMYDEAQNRVRLFSKKTTETFKGAWTVAKTSIEFIAGGISDKVSGINTYEMKKELKENVEKSKNKKTGTCFSLRDDIIIAKEKIAEITNEHTVVVVVDELDRCLPEYAIKVLERLHHIFDGIENLIVVLAVDKKQLNQTVSQIFGFEKNNNDGIDSYLRKFISFEIKLDKGIVDEKYKDKYRDYISRFDQCEDKFEVDKYVSLLLKPFDSRTRDKIFEKALLLHSIIFDEKVDVAVMCVELLWVVSAKLSNSPFVFNVAKNLPDETNRVASSFSDFFKKEIVDCVNLEGINNPIKKDIGLYQMDVNNLTTEKRIMYLVCSNDGSPTRIRFDDITEETEKMENYAMALKVFTRALNIIN